MASMVDLPGYITQPLHRCQQMKLLRFRAPVAHTLSDGNLNHSSCMADTPGPGVTRHNVRYNYARRPPPYLFALCSIKNSLASRS